MKNENVLQIQKIWWGFNIDYGICTIIYKSWENCLRHYMLRASYLNDRYFPSKLGCQKIFKMVNHHKPWTLKLEFELNKFEFLNPCRQIIRTIQRLRWSIFVTFKDACMFYKVYYFRCALMYWAFETNSYLQFNFKSTKKEPFQSQGKSRVNKSRCKINMDSVISHSKECKEPQ